MTVFESRTTIKQPVDKVYSFLSDMNNHQMLMPDNVEDWASSKDSATFNIKNIAKISIVIASRKENSEIVIIPVEKPPFNLELKWNLLEDGVNAAVIYTITADLNMMMKMLASGQLQKLADAEIQNLSLALN